MRPAGLVTQLCLLVKETQYQQRLQLPIPDYVVIRNEGTPNEKKITLRQLILERAEVKDFTSTRTRK